jgi:hypothetical protein
MACIFLAAMAIYSTANMHNHMVEKRARKDAIDWLLSRGVPRDTIDASWIFNGEPLSERYGTRPPPDANAHVRLKAMLSKEWYRRRDYVIATRDEPNYQLLRKFPVERWPIWGGKGVDVLVLKSSANQDGERQ